MLFYKFRLSQQDKNYLIWTSATIFSLGYKVASFCEKTYFLKITTDCFGCRNALLATNTD